MFPDTPGWPLVLALYVGSALYWSITRLQIFVIGRHFKE